MPVLKLYQNGKYVVQGPGPEFFTMSMDDCYQNEASYQVWVRKLATLAHMCKVLF